MGDGGDDCVVSVVNFDGDIERFVEWDEDDRGGGCVVFFSNGDCCVYVFLWIGEVDGVVCFCCVCFVFGVVIVWFDDDCCVFDGCFVLCYGYCCVVCVGVLCDVDLEGIGVCCFDGFGDYCDGEYCNDYDYGEVFVVVYVIFFFNFDMVKGENCNFGFCWILF